MKDFEKLSEEQRAKKILFFKNTFYQKRQWFIHSGKWSRLHAKYAFEQQQQMPPKYLTLYANKEPQIIQQITQPYFVNLLDIELSSLSVQIDNNKICTLNGISKIKAPLLQSIVFGDNFITSIKQLRKVNFPKLKLLSLYANRVVQISDFAKCDFRQIEVNYRNIKQLILGLNCIGIFDGLNKCPWNHIKKISIENNRKINNIEKRLTKFQYIKNLTNG